MPRLLLLFFFFWIAASQCPDEGPAPPLSPLVSFLERLQLEALKSLGQVGLDPKAYTDLPLRKNLNETEAAFWNLPRVNGSIPTAAHHGFLAQYVGDSDGCLVRVEPADFVPEPEGFLPGVEDPNVRAWALRVHSLWKILSRRVSDDVRMHPERHTLLPLPEPMIIPGARFTEVYYWDSYWIIRGLLVSKMYDTAKAIVSNLLWLVETYGYVLNGARTYYANRSQPPLLSSMVMEIYTSTSDLAFVRTSFPLLLKEYSFWDSGIHKVMIQDLQGRNHSLSRYHAMWNKPRPECAIIDEKLASKFLNESEQKDFYRQVASGAETGWDFSSRWFRKPLDMTTISSTLIIPADLNAYLLKMEHDMEIFAQLLGDVKTSKKFTKASKSRQVAIREILWNEKMSQWLDYWLDPNDCKEIHQFDPENQNHGIFASNFIPIWNWRHGLGKDRNMTEKILKSFNASGLLQPAGIATSIKYSGQQWDFPNGWAPLQHMIIEGLSNSGSRDAWELAEEIAIRWIRTNYVAYNTTGAMHEKYDVQHCGKIGRGGEYEPQTGFGWSNGVLLALLEEFGWPSNRDIECPL